MSATPTTLDTLAGTLGTNWEQTGFFRGLEGTENEKLPLEAPPGVPYGPLIFGSSPIAPTKIPQGNQQLTFDFPASGSVLGTMQGTGGWE